MKKENKWRDLSKEIKGFEDLFSEKNSLKTLMCIEGGQIAGPSLGKKNVESGHLDNIRHLAAEGTKKWFKNNPEKAKQNGSDAGKKSVIVNKEIGTFKKLGKYKSAIKLKEWAIKLNELPDKFLPADAKKLITHKQWYNVTVKTNLVIKTEEFGGYHNINRYYIKNNQAIQDAINSIPKYGETNPTTLV